MITYDTTGTQNAISAVASSVASIVPYVNAMAALPPGPQPIMVNGQTVGNWDPLLNLRNVRPECIEWFPRSPRRRDRRQQWPRDTVRPFDDFERSRAAREIECIAQRRLEANGCEGFAGPSSTRKPSR
jgi:hypothetical protein